MHRNKRRRNHLPCLTLHDLALPSKGISHCEAGVLEMRSTTTVDLPPAVLAEDSGHEGCGHNNEEECVGGQKEHELVPPVQETVARRRVCVQVVRIHVRV